MGNKVFGFILIGLGTYIVLRRGGGALAGLGALPDVHRQEAGEDLGVMSRLVSEAEGHVSAGRCKDSLASAGKAAVSAGKVERNLEYADSAFKASYERMNARRMKSRDAFAVRCMG